MRICENKARKLKIKKDKQVEQFEGVANDDVGGEDYSIRMGSTGSYSCVNDNPPEKPHLDVSGETVDAEASEDISATIYESSGDRNRDHHEPENQASYVSFFCL